MNEVKSTSQGLEFNKAYRDLRVITPSQDDIISDLAESLAFKTDKSQNLVAKMSKKLISDHDYNKLAAYKYADGDSVLHK